MPKSFKKFLLSSSSSASTSRTPNEPPPPHQPIPAAFICPISSLLMFSPVLTDSGHSLDQPCFQACKHLNFTPPHLIPPPTPNLANGIVCNVNLSKAIREWCRTYGHPPPVPIDPEHAHYIVKGLKFMTNPVPAAPPVPLPFFPFDPKQEVGILHKLQEPNPFKQESGLDYLIKTPFCSPRILASVVPLLSSKNPRLVVPSNHVICNLSLQSENRVHIFRAGAVPHLITVINSTGRGSGRAPVEATKTLCSLAEDDPYCSLWIGALGGIEPLLVRFCDYQHTYIDRNRAGLALQHLLSHSKANAEVLAESEGMRRLMEKAAEEESPRYLRKQALELENCLVVGVERGRDDAMDVENISKLLNLLKVEEGVGWQSLNVLYNLCRGNRDRFREVMVVTGGEVPLGMAMGDWGARGKQMTSGMLKVIRGELNEGEQLDEITFE